ncbi:MAG: hypothetical protein IIA83_05665 [Thaumarchaeota archaeon]|nr:hypothetical protein [Nitrososphaerota archaeon]
MEEETYKRKVYCTNCNFRNEIDIAKGTKVEKATCPNCGNKTLEGDDFVEPSL